MTQSHTVRVSQEQGGPPILEIGLGKRLALPEIEALAGEVGAKVAGFGGVPFSLLIDTRSVEGAEPAAGERLARLESDLAGQGLLRVAHVVQSRLLPVMKPRLEEQYRALGHPDLIGTFDDPTAATRFLSTPPFAGEEGGEQ